MSPQSVLINGAEVLKASSRQSFALMGILWDQYRQDLSAGRSAGDFTLLTRKELADRAPGYVEDLDAVRRCVKRLQARIGKACKESLKRDIGPDAVIFSGLIEGVGKQKRGYGLNPLTLCVAPY